MLSPSSVAPSSAPPPVLCFSHARWDYVFQRPQQLMSRFAADRRVFFIEEPVVDPGRPRLELRAIEAGVTVVVPRLPASRLAEPATGLRLCQTLLDDLVAEQNLDRYVCWYTSPAGLPPSAHLRPSLVVYDCVEEVAQVRTTSSGLAARELELFARADLVFTGGQSLYEAKGVRHPRVFCFPSGVDVDHFVRARSPLPEPADQGALERPRVGYAGVIDERLDLGLVAAVAEARPRWQLVLVGPVSGLDAAALPRRPNLHYLGLKPYRDLPAYFAGWEAAMLPYLRGESTRFVSPAKTPEYLAAGRPVVSTAIRDVVRPYGQQGLVHIADRPGDFVAALEAAMASDRRSLRARADFFLARTSWSETARRMTGLMDDALRARGPRRLEERTAPSPRLSA